MRKSVDVDCSEGHFPQKTVQFDGIVVVKQIVLVVLEYRDGVSKENL